MKHILDEMAEDIKHNLTLAGLALVLLLLFAGSSALILGLAYKIFMWVIS